MPLLQNILPEFASKLGYGERSLPSALRSFGTTSNNAEKEDTAHHWGYAHVQMHVAFQTGDQLPLRMCGYTQECGLLHVILMCKTHVIGGLKLLLTTADVTLYK